MRLISHRGNTNGKNIELENSPNYIDSALSKGYDVEVDVWYKDSKLWLGHDLPEYLIDLEYFTSRIEKLWVHCKNIECLNYFKNCGYEINYFWHQTDDVTITSKGYFWTYPGKKITNNSVYVIDKDNFEHFNSNIEYAHGICSDNIEYFSGINSRKKVFILLNGIVHNSIYNIMEEYFRIFRNHRIYFIISTWESEYSKIDFHEKLYKVILHKDKSYNQLLSEKFPLTQQLQHAPEDWKPAMVGHYANFVNILDSLRLLEFNEDLNDDDILIKSRTDIIVNFKEDEIGGFINDSIITFPTYWGGQMNSSYFINDHFLMTTFSNAKLIYNPVENMYKEFGRFRNPEMYMKYLIDNSGIKIKILNPSYYILSKEKNHRRSFAPTDCLQTSDQVLVFNNNWIDVYEAEEYVFSLPENKKNYILDSMRTIGKSFDNKK